MLRTWQEYNWTMAIMHDLEEEESDAENISSVDTFVKNMSLTYIFNSSACTLQDDGWAVSYTIIPFIKTFARLLLNYANFKVI